jgi:hypothetical protein
VNPRNCCTSVGFRGIGQSVMPLSLPGFMHILFCPMMTPKYSILVFSKAHFLGFRYTVGRVPLICPVRGAYIVDDVRGVVFHFPGASVWCELQYHPCILTAILEPLQFRKLCSSSFGTWLGSLLVQRTLPSVQIVLPV